MTSDAQGPLDSGEAAVAGSPLTVLMPVRNAVSQVGLAVSDLLAGMAMDDELLVVDDGSEDGSHSVLVKLARTDNRVRVIRTEGLGLVGALNLGLEESAHEWIARADADDRYPPTRLPLQRSARRTGTVLITGDYEIVSSGRSLGIVPCALSHPFVAASLINPQRIPHPGVLLHRSAALEVGGYRTADFPAEDLGLWLRLAGMGDFIGVPHLVVRWTMSATSTSHRLQAKQRHATARLLEDFPRMSCLSSLSREAVDSEARRYNGTTASGRRRVLLCRDLLALRAIDCGPSRRAVLRILTGHPISSIGALGALRHEQYRRRRERERYAALPR